MPVVAYFFSWLLPIKDKSGKPNKEVKGAIDRPEGKGESEGGKSELARMEINASGRRMKNCVWPSSQSFMQSFSIAKSLPHYQATSTLKQSDNLWTP